MSGAGGGAELGEGLVVASNLFLQNSLTTMPRVVFACLLDGFAVVGTAAAEAFIARCL